jgi:hypothetical protein
MNRFEYHTDVSDKFLTAKELDQAGAVGWELVNFAVVMVEAYNQDTHMHEMKPFFYYVFKRDAIEDLMQTLLTETSESANNAIV